MAPISILFGILLTLLGGGYFAALAIDFSDGAIDWGKATALIPAGFGLSLIGLGILARDEKKRMHAMHGAALVGLFGAAIPMVMVIRYLGPAQNEQILMAALCLVFVVLCVKSFIDARSARKQKEAQSSPPPSA